jgi:hypothetical protein
MPLMSLGTGYFAVVQGLVKTPIDTDDEDGANLDFLRALPKSRPGVESGGEPE